MIIEEEAMQHRQHISIIIIIIIIITVHSISTHESLIKLINIHSLLTLIGRIRCVYIFAEMSFQQKLLVWINSFENNIFDT